ncbi:alpha/beta fold hydrolase [Granulicella tundricola]|uniref:Alpha/beta hydrolase fold protein n=1 Tax=Granulicella tundricola (strain ATCC BAA-1859 / DSM 23138 / MP5ACTX9) TaxID=1198114 RepID=E8X5U9_GRATM|nr:alpha/beta hydrolase [Granulicella tundricola]ADW70833.1 alpha/beta hydrolase fold protein [Granulicella tundricola MP5ACTX9]
MVRTLWLLILAPLLPVVGLLYQWIGLRYDRRRFLRLGRLVDIGKRRRLFMMEMGDEAGPSVIFESGIGSTSQNWARIQESVSEFAHTVSYDRLGLGWSTPAVSERIPSMVVQELRAMLQAAGIAPPYLLVGHSFGGLVVRYFAAEYPDEVIGVVLVDAMRTDEWPPVDESQRKLLDRGVQLTQWAVPIAYSGLARLTTMSFLHRSGRFTNLFTRVTGGRDVLERVTSELNKMPSAVWPIVAAHWSNPAYFRGMTAHIKGVPATVAEMLEATPIVGMPVVLLTPGHPKAISDTDLRKIGLDAEQLIAEKSGHWVHLDEPELVIEQIREMITVVRTGSPCKDTIEESVSAD